MDAHHATFHVTCREWVSFGRRLRGRGVRREVLVAELMRRSFGAGRAWSAITDGAR
jgi:hypothetical protein